MQVCIKKMVYSRSVNITLLLHMILGKLYMINFKYQKDQEWSEHVKNISRNVWTIQILEITILISYKNKISLTRQNGLYELKASSAERIMELVEQLKEKQG